MQILLVAATEMEIKPFVKLHPETDFLITGVGIPATLYHLQKRLLQIDYDLVVQAGIAGSFKPSLNPGELVIVKSEAFGDLGLEEAGHFTSLFKGGLAEPNEFPFESGWLINPLPHLSSFQLPLVKGITVNKVTDNKTTTRQLIDSFSPDVETMEGAALHYVCLQEKIPFIQLRSISNFTGERDKSKWKLTAAVEKLNNGLTALFDRLKNPA